MVKFDYDFVVIGGGPAGRRAAIQASKLGKSVAVVDDQKSIGGVSVHTGAVRHGLARSAFQIPTAPQRGPGDAGFDQFPPCDDIGR